MRRSMQTLENNKVRLVDIAREVNVSAALVSKVLNGNSGNIRVSPEKAGNDPQDRQKDELHTEHQRAGAGGSEHES